VAGKEAEEEEEEEEAVEEEEEEEEEEETEYGGEAEGFGTGCDEPNRNDASTTSPP
jgi:hypothetical protein